MLLATRTHALGRAVSQRRHANGRRAHAVECARVGVHTRSRTSDVHVHAHVHVHVQLHVHVHVHVHLGCELDDDARRAFI